MDYKTVNKKRYSVRDFSDRNVDNEILTRITKEAQHTPSWANAQPWKVYFATGETLQKIRKEYKKYNRLGINPNSDFYTMHRNDWGNYARNNMADWNNDFSRFLIENRINFGQISDDLFNAPVAAFLTIEEFNPWSAYDLGAFGENLMLAASDAGLASMPAFEFVKYPDILREYLPVPDKELIGMGIGLGYASDKKVNEFHSSRVPLDEMMKISE